jgi:hypothetical protein
MKLSLVKKLHTGDEVRWTDPDGDACSRAIIIMEIVVKGDVVQITDDYGNYLECLAKELS